MTERSDEDTTNEQRLRSLGTRSPRCSVPGCNEVDPFALTGAHPHIVCYEHQAEANGRSVIEDQHTQGRANGPWTVAMLGNDHRVADSYKTDWPRDTLRNLDGSPLLRAAACIRGWMDVLRVIMERTVGWIPALLEWLDACLVGLVGHKWWTEPGWVPPP